MASIILRNQRDAAGTRFLGASLMPNGDLVIEGQDIGDGVEAVWGEGIREYEWTYTIAHTDLALLRKALDADGDLLAALAQRFSHERANDLHPFLKAHAIPYQFWSRTGD